MHVGALRVIVTGAAGGLGRECCLQLCCAGAQVVGIDVDTAALEAFSRDVEQRSFSETLKLWRTDVSVEAEVVDSVARAVEELGSVNALINNAGIFRDGLLVRRTPDAGVVKMPLAQWRRVVDADLTGSFLMAREVAAHMVRDGISPGLIVNISSVSRSGVAGQGNYSAAKAALVADTRAWSQELAEHGIRVVAIAPGLFNTPMLSALTPDVLSDWIAKIPAGRLGTPAEMFAAVRFIVECEYFNGRCLELDGGLSI